MIDFKIVIAIEDSKVVRDLPFCFNAYISFAMGNFLFVSESIKVVIGCIAQIAGHSGLG